jgi:hypothetical protein
MPIKVQGIVGDATLHHVVGRKSDCIYIILMDEVDGPLPNTKCNVKFQNGQTIQVSSDDEGVLEFPREAEGEVEIEFLERKRRGK